MREWPNRIIQSQSLDLRPQSPAGEGSSFLTHDLAFVLLFGHHSTFLSHSPSSFLLHIASSISCLVSVSFSWLFWHPFLFFLHSRLLCSACHLITLTSSPFFSHFLFLPLSQCIASPSFSAFLPARLCRNKNLFDRKATIDAKTTGQSRIKTHTHTHTHIQTQDHTQNSS